MRHLKLTLLLTVAMMSLCPSVAHAWQTVSGNVNVSSLTDQRIMLGGNTTITVDQDWYLREISGVYNVLTIIINSNCTLTVDQDNANLAAIDVASLDISGSGDLLCTGRNYGAYIRAGYLRIHNYSGTASFHGRDGSWSHGVWLLGGGNVIPVTISSGTVNFQAGPGYGLGGNGTLTVTGNNTVVNVSSDQDGINFDAAGNAGEVNVTGGSLNIYGKRYAIYCEEVNLNAGSSLQASNGDAYAAVRTIGFNATNCYANVTSVGNGIEATYLTTQDAEIHAYGGNRAYGLYARTKAPGTLGVDGYIALRGTGGNSKIYAEGYYGGIRSEANISIENRYVYAKARASGCSAVSAAGDLSFYTTPYSVYEAYSASYPFFADGQIKMYQPFNDRFSLIYSMLLTTSRYDVSSDQHHFVTFSGSGTSSTPALGQVLIRGTWLTEANVEMSHTLWAKYNGYYQTYPAAAYKGEEVMFKEPTLLSNYVLHNPTNNPVSNYPHPSPVRTVTWYRVNDAGTSIQVGTGDTYTPTAADVGYRLKAMVSYSSHQGAIYSSDLPVVAKENNNEPIKPVLQITTPSGSTTRYVYVTAYPDQEYIVLTTQKDVSELTESDWANAKSRSTQGLLQLCQADYDHTYYVYTRFKATDTYAPGTQVKYSSISGGTSVNYTGIQMTATPMNGATMTPDDMGYCVLKNTVVKITISPVPYNATNFNGVLGSGLRIGMPSGSTGTQWNNECGALYADAACTQSLVSNQYYKTVYAKLLSNIDQQNYGYTYVYAYLAGYTDRIKFVVANDNGTWDPFSLDVFMGTSHELRFKKGCSVTNPFAVQPAVADISNLTVEYVGYTGSLTNPTPPTVTVDTQAKTYTVSNYEATTDENGKYRFNFKVGDRIVSYLYVVVEKRPVESITVSPNEATIDPLVGQLQLQASIYSEYAEDEIVWASSAPSIIAVDENGLVTLTNVNSALGETYLITATAGDFTDTCVVHVGGEKYDLWVRNTRVNSLNQLDILGMAGAISYSNGVLTLDGVSLGSTTYSYPIIRSEMPNLTINLVGTNSAIANTTTATIFSSGNLKFTGDGNLSVQNRNTGTTGGVSISGGIVAKILQVTGTAQVTVKRAVIGVAAQNGLSVTYGAQLKAIGSTASVRAMGSLDGVITEPSGAAWNTNTGYVTDRMTGNIIAGVNVTIVGEEPAVLIIRGDVNGDGDIDINDVTLLIDVVLGKNVEYVAAAADCNSSTGDNSIDINDVTALIGRVLTGNW